MPRSYTNRLLTTLSGAYANPETKQSEVVLAESFSRARVSFYMATSTSGKVIVNVQGAASQDATDAEWFNLENTPTINGVTVVTGESKSVVIQNPSKYIRVKIGCSTSAFTLGAVLLELSTE